MDYKTRYFRIHENQYQKLRKENKESWSALEKRKETLEFFL